MQLFYKKNNKNKRPIHDISIGVVPNTIHLNKSWFSKSFKWLSRPRYAIPSTIVILMLIALTFGLPFSKASVATFYFSSCLGGWENPSNAAGESELLNQEDTPNELNSAELKQGIQPLFCGQIYGEPIPDTKIRSARVKLVLNLREKNTIQVEVNQDLVTPEGVLVPELQN